MAILHVIFLSKIIPSYIALVTKGMLVPLNVRIDSDGLIRWEQLIARDFYPFLCYST
jgi:hypothetical protein